MHKALIIVDYINEICHKEGAFGCYPMLAENQSISKLNRTLTYVRKEQWLVIWIIVGFDKNYLEVNAESPLFSRAKESKKLQRDTWGTEIISDVVDSKDVF